MIRKIRELDIDKVQLDTAQPRGIIKIKQLRELSEDIKERGLLYPILVTPYYKERQNLILGKKALDSRKCRWWVLDGERRTRAIKLLNENKIDAIIQMDLTFLQMIEIQFASNTKRVQITIEEMAKSVKRFKIEFKKENPKEDPIKRLVELTGYSYSYFDMAEAINRAPKPLQEKIFDGGVGGYTATEIEKATKDTSLRKGITKAYIKSEKPISALGVRAIKQDLRKIEKKEITSKEKEELAESIMDKWANRNSEETDNKSNFLRYRNEAENFLDEIKKWNVDDLTDKQINELISIVDSIKNYFVEERRKTGRLKFKKKTRNI